MRKSKKNKNKICQKDVIKREKRKKIITVSVTAFIIVAVIVGISLILAFGGRYKSYSLNDLRFKLPVDFKETNFGYGDIEYSDGNGAYFMMNSYDAQQMMEHQGQDPNITVQEYAQTFISVWNLDSEYVYDAEKEAAVFDYHIEDAGEYYKHFVLRGSEKLFFFTVSCDSEKIDEYSKTFDFILDNIVVY